MIVDAHMHVWERVHGRVRGELRVEPSRNGRIKIGGRECLGMPAWMLDCAARAEYAVAEFDAAGVDAGVIVQEDLDGEQNEYVLAVQERFPGRFFAHALPDLSTPGQVARQAGELLDRGFRGLKFCGGHVRGKLALDDQRLMPIYERMEAEELVLAVDLAEGEEQAAEMERVLARCPRLRVAVGHFGMPNRGGWPGQLRLALHEHVFVEGGGLVWLYRGEGSPFPGAIDAILRAKEVVGIEKLLWGSDWPRTMIDFTYRQSLDFVRASEALTESEKARFLGENAARLYGFEVPTEERRPLARITEG